MPLIEPQLGSACPPIIIPNVGNPFTVLCLIATVVCYPSKASTLLFPPSYSQRKFEHWKISQSLMTSTFKTSQQWTQWCLSSLQQTCFLFFFWFPGHHALCFLSISPAAPSVAFAGSSSPPIPPNTGVLGTLLGCFLYLHSLHL